LKSAEKELLQGIDDYEAAGYDPGFLFEDRTPIIEDFSLGKKSELNGMSPSNTSLWEKYAGIELLGIGLNISGAGTIALTGSGSTGIAATGVTLSGVVAGGGAIILGGSMIAIDLLEGEGLDKTDKVIDWLLGAE
jgi:hypothetical protein